MIYFPTRSNSTSSFTETLESLNVVSVFEEDVFRSSIYKIRNTQWTADNVDE